MGRKLSTVLACVALLGCSSGPKQVRDPVAEEKVEGCWAEQACASDTMVCLTPGSPPCTVTYGCSISVFPQATCETSNCPEGEVCVNELHCLESMARCMDDDQCASGNLMCYVKPGADGHCVRRTCQVSSECEGYCVEGWCFDEPGFCSDASVL
jgi:hypothetical protein